MADQDRAKNCCQIGWIGCPILQLAQKSHHEISISYIFLQSSRHEKRCQMVERLFLVFHHSKGGFKSEGRGGFSQLPKMSAEKIYIVNQICRLEIEI